MAGTSPAMTTVVVCRRGNWRRRSDCLVIPGRSRQRANPESRSVLRRPPSSQFEIPGSRYARPGMTAGVAEQDDGVRFVAAKALTRPHAQR